MILFHFTLTDGQNVRLVGGQNKFEGRVEIYHSGTWGTICDDQWDLYDGHVVCNMLGYGTAVSAPTGAHFGSGTGEILLDEVLCHGIESNIAFCSHSAYRDHNCDHNEDAGVICSPIGTVKCYNNIYFLSNKQFVI